MLPRSAHLCTHGSTLVGCGPPPRNRTHVGFGSLEVTFRTPLVTAASSLATDRRTPRRCPLECTARFVVANVIGAISSGATATFSRVSGSTLPILNFTFAIARYENVNGGKTRWVGYVAGGSLIPNEGDDSPHTNRALPPCDLPHTRRKSRPGDRYRTRRRSADGHASRSGDVVHRRNRQSLGDPVTVPHRRSRVWTGGLGVDSRTR